jgi:hypothetical protein
MANGELNATFLPPDRARFAGVATTYLARPYDHPRGHLLRPLQANLGYYEGSVALQVDRVRCLTSVGDPAFMM